MKQEKKLHTPKPRKTSLTTLESTNLLQISRRFFAFFRDFCRFLSIFVDFFRKNGPFFGLFSARWGTMRMSSMDNRLVGTKTRVGLQVQGLTSPRLASPHSSDE
jgi:hypothetical protein